jgi:GalNAc-alpha-(1->4)-GalNAc-alpha-(1->3)-diNAcBac-PP-undecaprenol alpha-1,4-N-acetyl-D-galactosaminyltransferase
LSDDSRKCDIVVVTSDMKSGGSQRVLSTLLNELSNTGVQITLLTRSIPESDFFQLNKNINRTVLQGHEGTGNLFTAIFYNIKWILKLRRAIRQSQAPVVLSFVAGTNILVVLACFRLKLHTVISERNDPARQSLGLAWDFLRRLTYRHANVVTANSYGALESLKQFVPVHRLAYVPNPLKVVSRTDVQREKIVLNVGRFHEQKAQDILITAFAMIASEYPEWKLAFLGQGKLKSKLSAQADQEGIGNRILWLPPTPEPYEHYARASVFALPSRHEGTPNALIEAMAAGLPSIVSDASPGPLEVALPDKDVLVVPVEDAEALSAALEKLMVEKNVRQIMGENARKSVGRFEMSGVLATWNRILLLNPR